VESPPPRHHPAGADRSLPSARLGLRRPAGLGLRPDRCPHPRHPRHLPRRRAAARRRPRLHRRRRRCSPALPPLQNEVTPGRRAANRAHSAIQRLVERGIATLKNWRVLTRVRASPERVTTYARVILTLEQRTRS
jgi:hypothetical protein